MADPLSQLYARNLREHLTHAATDRPSGIEATRGPVKSATGMNYVIPILLLILTMVAFFATGRGNYASFGTAQSILRIFVALPLLASAFLLHFLRTSATASMIPPVFPARMFLVIITGVLEIAGAIGLFVPRFRRSAAFWIAIMMVAIIPANVYVAGNLVEGIQMPGLVPRTAMQVIYIVLVLIAGYGIPGKRRRGVYRRNRITGD
jgi:uncharacterized membrane protein